MSYFRSDKKRGKKLVAQVGSILLSSFAINQHAIVKLQQDAMYQNQPAIINFKSVFRISIEGLTNAKSGNTIKLSIAELYLYAVIVSIVPSGLYLSSVTFTQRKCVFPPESVLS